MDIISISFGFAVDVPAIANAIENAYVQGIIILASASNEGANERIAFPARLKNVFCIGAADGKGYDAGFNPPYVGMEKYSALGDSVSGADVQKTKPTSSQHSTISRRSGTSTATPIAAGIAANFLEYTRQFLKPGKGPENSARIKKLFLEMSKATVTLPYRFLVPWSLFKPNLDPSQTRESIREILRRSACTIPPLALGLT